MVQVLDFVLCELCAMCYNLTKMIIDCGEGTYSVRGLGNGVEIAVDDR